MTDIPTRETIVQLLRTGAPLSDVVRAYLLGWLEVERIREINKDVRFQMQPRESGSRPTRDRPWLRGICRRSQYRMTMTNPKTHGAMKRTSWLLLLLAISLLLLLGVAFGSAEELNVYDRNGSYQGSVFDYGRSQTFTDRHGQFTGSSITHGNSTGFYDRSGHFTGSVIRPSTSTSHSLTGGK